MLDYPGRFVRKATSGQSLSQTEKCLHVWFKKVLKNVHYRKRMVLTNTYREILLFLKTRSGLKMSQERTKPNNIRIRMTTERTDPVSFFKTIVPINLHLHRGRSRHQLRFAQCRCHCHS